MKMPYDIPHFAKRRAVKVETSLKCVICGAVNRSQCFRKKTPDTKSGEREYKPMMVKIYRIKIINSNIFNKLNQLFS